MSDFKVSFVVSEDLLGRIMASITNKVSHLDVSLIENVPYNKNSKKEKTKKRTRATYIRKGSISSFIMDYLNTNGPNEYEYIEQKCLNKKLNIRNFDKTIKRLVDNGYIEVKEVKNKIILISLQK